METIIKMLMSSVRHKFLWVFFFFSLKNFVEGGEECPLVSTEVPLLKCSTSKLGAFSLGEVGK